MYDNMARDEKLTKTVMLLTCNVRVCLCIKYKGIDFRQ